MRSPNDSKALQQESLHLSVDRGWHMHIPLPQKAQADFARLLFEDKGHETLPPEKVGGGWVVKYRRIRKGRKRKLNRNMQTRIPPSARYLCFLDDAGKLSYGEIPDGNHTYDHLHHSADFGFVIVYHPSVLQSWERVDTSWTRASASGLLGEQSLWVTV